MRHHAAKSTGPTLHFTDRHMIDFGTGSLLIEAVQGDERVTCRISSMALVEKAGATAGDEHSLWVAYRRIQSGVQRAAARKMAAGEWAPDGSLFIDSADLD